MKKSKFTEEQIAYALRQVESGTPPADVCRQLGVSEATFYFWKKKYAHLGVSELVGNTILKSPPPCSSANACLGGLQRGHQSKDAPSLHHQDASDSIRPELFARSLPVTLS